MVNETIIVTGCAGFIGSHLGERLLSDGYRVIGIDIVNDYYDINQKKENLAILNEYKNFEFYQEDICNNEFFDNLLKTNKVDVIIHLAAMAGVRYSLENPLKYESTNIAGFINILECCKKYNINKLIFASSSSVYGLNEKTPFSETDDVNCCNSPYACSKLSMEIYAKTYARLYGMSIIGLRFFTVYGPRGRSDMAPYIFLKSILEGRKIKKYGDGTTSRDYTYISDIVDGIALSNIKLLSSNIDFEIINLGNNYPVSLNRFIEICELVSNKRALIETLPHQLEMFHIHMQT